MIEESIKSIKAELYDRVSSPLIFGFCVAWCVWNYKFLLVLLSDEKVLEKVRIIDEILYGTDQQILFNGILYPLLSSLIYIFIYPYPAKFIFSFYKKKQSEIVLLKKEIENENLLTLEESLSIRSRIDELRYKHGEDLKRKDEEINFFKNHAEINQVAADMSRGEKSNKNNMGNEQIGILDAIEKLREVNVERMSPPSNMSRRMLMYIVEDLESRGYLYFKVNDDKDKIHSVTAAGRKLLVEEEEGIDS